MKKKILSLAPAAILILTLAACGGSGDPASDFEYYSDAAEGGVVLTKYIGTSTKVRIPSKIEGEPVVWIGYEAFRGSGVMEVYIPNSVTSIGRWAFEDCIGLTSVTIGNSVTEIGWDAFSGCTGLTSITIPDSVTEIGWDAFSGCTGLTSVTIPDSVTEIGGYAFEDCVGLTNITIPDSVTEIGWDVFAGIPDLRVTYKGETYTEMYKLYDAVNGR